MYQFVYLTNHDFLLAWILHYTIMKWVELFLKRLKHLYCFTLSFSFFLKLGIGNIAVWFSMMIGRTYFVVSAACYQQNILK